MNSYSLQWLVGRISENLSQNQAELMPEFAEAFFETLKEGLKNDGVVVINNFGVFSIEAGKVTFMPDSAFADAVNLPFAYFEPIPVDDEGLLSSLEQLELNSDKETVKVANNNSVPENVTNIETGILQPETENPVTESTDSPKVVETISEPAEENAAEPAKDGGCYNGEMQAPDAVSEKTEEINAEPEADEEYNYPERHRSAIPHIFWIILVFVFGAGIGYIIGSNYPYYERWTPESEEIIEEETVEEENNAYPAAETDTLTIEAQQPEQPEETPAAKEEIKPETKVVYDTIARNRFLSRIAKRHYGSSEFWSYIYLENSNRLGHPDRIPEGTVLVIPPAEKYGIDASDPASVSKAKAEQAKIYKSFKK